VRSIGILIVAAGAACFPPDLGEGRIACGSGGACPPGYSCAVDNRCYSHPIDGGGADLATSGVNDLAVGSDTCGAQVSRICTDAGHSATCFFANGMWMAVPDRTCPPGSTCAAGHCQPPAGAATCTSDNGCGADVCIEYVQGASLVGFCTTPIVKAMGNLRCAMPGYDNTTCATGICARSSSNMTVIGCLAPCTQMSDCATRRRRSKAWPRRACASASRCD
jgi:hypothetical protein